MNGSEEFGVIISLLIYPYFVSLLIIRPCFYYWILRKNHSNSYLKKHRNSNFLLRLIYWDYRTEINKFFYGFYIFSLCSPPLLLCLYLIYRDTKGEKIIYIWGLLILILLAVRLMVFVTGRAEELKKLHWTRKGAIFAYRTSIILISIQVIVIICILVYGVLNLLGILK